MKISYIERNGRKYAYTCTSRRVPGKNNPVSKMTYLGVVDPESGEILPKKSRTPEPICDSDEVDMKRLGDALLVMSVAERLGIPEDLQAVFGDDHRMILAIALAEAIHPSTTNLVDTVLKSSAIPELLGLEPSEVSKRNVMRALNSIDRHSAERFFVLRWARVGGSAMVFSHTVSLSDGFHDTIGDLSGLSGADDVTVSIITDSQGSMIGFSLVQHPPTDISGTIETMERMRSAGIECVYISDTSVSASLRLDELVLRDLDFIIPYSVASPQFLRMYNDYSDLSDQKYTHNYDGSTYQMKEGSVRLVVENGRCVLIPPDDPRFRKQGASLNVFMVSDPRINRNTVRSMDVIVRSLKARLDGTISDDPDTTLSLIAGQFAPLLGYTVMPDGTLSVSVKRDAMKRFHENAGKALILTRSSSWDDIIKARETLVNINAAMEQFFKGSRWVLKYIVKGTDMEGQMFAEFVAMLIYDSILRTLRSCGDGSDVDETVFVASTYMMSIINGRTVRSNVNRKQRRLFDMFGLDPYKCPIGFETRKHVGIHGALSETSGPD